MPKPAAQRSLAVAEHVPGKPNSRAEIIVISPAQIVGGRKTSRPALAGKNRPRIAGTGVLASLICPAPVVMLSMNFWPGPFMKVVARLFSSVFRV